MRRIRVCCAEVLFEWSRSMPAHRTFRILEHGFLIIIAVMTVVAMGQEVWRLFIEQKVELKDLLLMFIYAEVLGMVGVFHTQSRIPIAMPLFIAITALARMIVLQGKDLDPSILLYESLSILLISMAWWILKRNKAPE